LKIGLPRLRLSRKLLIITLGITVLLGGTGMTALYFGGDSLVIKGGENAIGGECTDVQTMVVKTPSDHLWLRKFIRMENASGRDMVRTALRISGNLAKNNAVDLIHVSVLDTHGPTKRADMRARAIGAEVLIALKPDNLPEMKSPAMASYYEGPASDEGRFYGDKVVVDIDEIGAMMTAMRTIEEKPDCISQNVEADATENDGHGKKDKSDAKPNDHGGKPADAQGEKPANDHGEEPAKEGGNDTDQNADAAKEQSFLDSMLSMVGLGGGDETAVEKHEPVAEEPAEAPAGGHDKQPDASAEHKASEAEPAADSHAKSETHEPVAKEPADDTDKAHGAEEADAHVPADDHDNPKKPKADKHAQVDMPVGD
jgi:hypothetical protein